jgi:hypothetical protein
MFFTLRVSKSDLQNVQVESSADFCQRESDGKFDYILIGKIYDEDRGSLKNLCQRLYLQNASVRGRFIFIEIDHEKSHITLWLDKYRLLNPVLYRDGDELLLSNRIQDLDSGEMDSLAVESLKEFGAVIYPHTLMKNKTFLKGTARWKQDDDSFYEEDHAQGWPREGAVTNTEEWLRIFSHTMDEIYEYWQPQFFRMSGGVDTRFMAFLLSPSAIKNIHGQVLCHPLLSLDQDRDVLGAQQIAELTGITLEALKPDNADYSYVGGIGKNKRAMAGLYGGEFFGGLMDNFAPWLGPLQNLKAGNPLHDMWKDRLNKLGPRRLTTELFLSAFRSTIYNSVLRSWASPWELNQRALSPFVEQQVLDALLKMPVAQLQSYSLYATVFKKVAAENVSFPMTSPIVGLQPGFLGFTTGIEPKSLANPTEITQAHKNLGEQNLECFLKEHPKLKFSSH